MSSCKQLSVPLCFCPSSSLVTLKRFAIKTPPFLALATPPQQLALPASHQCGHLYIVVLFLPNKHFFRTLWIFRPQSFFQILPHVPHCLLTVVCSYPLVLCPCVCPIKSFGFEPQIIEKIHHIISIELQSLKYGLNLLYCCMFKHYPLSDIKCIN